MQRLILIRIGQGLVALLVVTVIVFVLSRATGDPADLMLSPWATEQERVDMSRALGLDKPLIQQYVIFLKDAAQGDLGESLRSRVPVAELYVQRLPRTLELTGAAVVLVILGSLLLGVVAAVRRGTVVDWIARLVATVGMAMPMFWLGLLLMQIFAVHFRWLPAGGSAGMVSIVLPAVSLGFHMVAGISRLLRSSMLEVLDSEYIKMKRIIGLAEWRIVFKHALRNAAVVPVTFLGQYVAFLVGGAVVIETVFAWPGVGRLAYEGIIYRDFPVIQGVIMINAAILIVANLVVDVLYAYIDPRIRRI